MARLSQIDLVDVNQTFEERTPQELLIWARETFGTRVAAISAMQRAGSVICHMLSQLGLEVPVLFVDTQVMFEETLETRDRIQREYGLDVRTLTPDMSMQEQCEEFGVLYTSPEGQEKCCHMRKVEPLLAVSGKFDAFISSLRRGDGGQRAQTPILAVDPETNTLRVNPLATFTNEQFDAYISEHEVIVNPLHAQGYPTVSCNRCTTPVLPSEPKRAGRWRHLGPWSQYCGINPTDMNPAHAPAIDLPQDLVDRILGRETDFMI
jgi:phosphoadenosine phosphosulfate reductase